jgi:hypothetical protein
VSLRLVPADRHAARLEAWDREWRVAQYRRRRVLGGGRLEADDAPGLRLLPERWWRRRWLVKAGSRSWAGVVSRPRGQPRLRFTWADGADPSGLACVCACYAILLDDLVASLMPAPSSAGGGP